MPAAVPVVSWSRCDGVDCLRISGARTDADVRVHTRSAALVGGLPPVAGTLVAEDDAICFMPRFPFVGRTEYTVLVDGIAAAIIARPPADPPPTTTVVEIFPTAQEVPRNLLRLYVHFSAPMSEGCAARFIRLVDDAGEEMGGALLASDYELWDHDRRRLTVLLDPARIKRGLLSHRQAGYPLTAGRSFRVAVDAGFRDARGGPLRDGAERRYGVSDDERRRVEPTDWSLVVPPVATTSPLHVAFDRSLDHALLGRCLHVVDATANRVEGLTEIGPQERSWHFTPRNSWQPGPHRLVVDPILEDPAGNSVARVFDRELHHELATTNDETTVTLQFEPTEVQR